MKDYLMLSMLIQIDRGNESMNCTRRSFLKGSLATIFFSNFNMPLYGSISNPKKYH